MQEPSIPTDIVDVDDYYEDAFQEKIYHRRSVQTTYDSISDNEFPIGPYYLNKYEFFPSYYSIYDSLRISVKFIKFLNDNFQPEKLHSHYYSDIKKKQSLFSEIYEIEKLKVLIKIIYHDKEEQASNEHVSAELYFTDYESILPIVKGSENFITQKSITNKISLVIQRHGEFDIKTFDALKVDDIDIASNYGESFVSLYDTVLKRLNTKHDKGIVLFHGDPGTGKSSLIKYLIKNIKKEILFVPPSMTESLSSPGLLTFLLQHSNSIFVIEDAEKVVMSREGGNRSESITNLLNVSDGILGDCLSIQIIASFNTKREKIDEALLRKGRLIAEHEFKALDIVHSNKLLKKLGKNHTAVKPMTLAEIYNVEQDEFITKKDNAIGFKTSKNY